MSRLDVFESCPYRAYLQYVEKIPQKPREIPEGPAAGVTYFGGSVLGYEHRLWPASIKRSPNAAYELGSPTSLGPQFGTGATWGRLDVSPGQKTEQVTFLHILDHHMLKVLRMR